MNEINSTNEISVFLSYAREDDKFAISIQKALTEKGIDVWMDQSELKPLEIWHEEIKNAIISHDYFIFIASKNSVSKDSYCLEEIRFAKEKNKIIVPINIDPNLEWLPDEIKDINWVNFSGVTFKTSDNTVGLHVESQEYKKTFSQLLTSISTNLDWVKTFTKLLQKTWEWEGNQRNDSYLLIGSELNYFTEAKTKYTGEEPALTREQIEFIDASVFHQTAQMEKQKKINRRQKIMLGLLGLLIIVITITSIVIRRQSIKFLSENLSKSSRLLSNDIDTALLLSLQANELNDSAEIQTSLFEGIIENNFVVHVFRIPTPIIK